MRYIKPYYFDSFQCAADKCPDTCCAGWQIMIDEDALEHYMQIEGEFGGKLATGIDWQESCFRQHGKRCSMLRDDNLCELVIALGEENLCETCSRYPRHVEEFEGLREWSLSLSCPVAAQIILTCEEPAGFVVEEDEKEDPLEEEFEEFDLFLFTKLEDARKILFQIVQEKNLPMGERMRLIAEFAWKLQLCVDEERLCDMDSLTESYAGRICATVEKNVMQEEQAEQLRFRELRKHFSVFDQLERLRDEWEEVMEDVRSTLYADEFRYRKIREEFLAEYGIQGKHYKQWERFSENLLLFFLYTYFCGAVYDDWIYSKAALAVFSALFVEEFVMCKWYLADKSISWEECVEMAYRYAREVEHSDENLNILEEWLQQNPYILKGTED